MSSRARGRPVGTTKTEEEKELARRRRRSKEKSDRTKQQQMMSSFFGAGGTSAANDNNADDSNNNKTKANRAEPSIEEGNESEAGNLENVVPERVEVDPNPIGGAPDDDDSSIVEGADNGNDYRPDDDGDPEDLFDGLKPEGAMKKYLQRVFERLQKELKDDFPTLQTKWLLDLLKEHGKDEWRIPAGRAKFVCKKLGIEYDEPSYYRDIVVWLPDVQFHLDVPCPVCGSGCKFHGWQTEHFGRIVVELYGHYYLISRRYKCTNCEEKVTESNAAMIQAASAAVARHGATIDPIVEENDIETGVENETAKHTTKGQKSKQPITSGGKPAPRYTFMGYNASSRKLLPDGLGSLFPAFLTHKGAVDISIIDLMRPLFDVGVRPTQLASILLELASKQYHRNYLRREQDIKRKREAVGQEDYKRGKLFSEFGDKKGYGGMAPSGKYLSHVYKLYAASIQAHLDKEVKKRGAEMLRWDVSYKEAKKLCRFRGKPVFKGLVTATNELGEIRIQFHIVTDGHDQMENAIQEFHKTTVQYGQQPAKYVFTDKPSEDCSFFIQQLPGVKEEQERLDEYQNEVSSDDLEPIEPCEVDLDDVVVLSKLSDINIRVTALLDYLKSQPEDKRVVGLDTEYEFGSKQQFPPKGKDKVAVIQLGYETDEPGKVKAMIIQCRRIRHVPDALVRLFKEPSILYVGSRVKGDIDKIGEDYGIEDITRAMRHEGLGKMAKNRGVVSDARTGLEKLVLLTLRQQIDKDKDVRTSKWNVPTLTDKQKTYAALDAIKSLEVYHKLVPLPDFTKRLSANEAKAGVKTDIIAPRGKAGSSGMLSVSAHGTIMEGTSWDPPRREGLRIERTQRRNGVRQQTRVVQVEKMFAPGLVIPGYKVHVNGSSSRRAILEDFATSTPFQLELPITMLKQHDPSTENLVEARLKVPSEAGGGSGPKAQWVRTDDDCSEGSAPPVSDERDEEESEEIENRKSMSKQEIAELQHVLTISRECQDIGTNHKLHDPPSAITDKYRSVLGDGFHLMDRPKVSVKAEHRKAYMVAFQEALYTWDPVRLAEVKDTLRKSGMSEEEIEAKMYYDTGFFLECTYRVILPPRLLYWRVRSVFATYGPKVDSATGKPLFNSRAWKKANNILKEILEGYYSDPPGVALYMQKLDDKGELQTNKYGLAVFWCLRGTNLTEVVHKQMLMSIGTWCTGIEMADPLRAEHRHRYNHRMSERRREGFPRIGHVDTWLVDALQILVEYNHNILLYPTWTNSGDFQVTPEGFGTVPLQSNELTRKVNQLDLSQKLTQEQQYLANKQGVKLPFTPVVFKEEKNLAKKLIVENGNDVLDVDTMALEWLNHVDGKHIFPKLPVYLRTYLDRYMKNRRIEEAMVDMADEVEKLKTINNKLIPCNDDDYDMAVSDTFDDTAGIVQDSPGAEPAARLWPRPIPPPPLAPPINILPIVQPRPIQFVGGVQIGISQQPVDHNTRKRKKGERSTDKKPRKPRTCKRCKRNNGVNAETCPGRAPRIGERGCLYFAE